MGSKWVPLVFRCQGQSSALVNPLLRVKSVVRALPARQGHTEQQAPRRVQGMGCQQPRHRQLYQKQQGSLRWPFCFLIEKLHSSFNGGKGKPGNPGVKYGLENLLADSLNISLQLKWQRQEHFRREGQEGE